MGRLAPIEPWYQDSALFFCMVSIVLQTTVVLNHCNFWLEVLISKFFDNPIHPIEKDEFTRNQIRLLIEDKLWIVAGSKESMKDIKLKCFPLDFGAQLLKLILLFTCFKSITLQWKIVNIVIFVTLFGILFLLQISKANVVQQYYQRRTVREYNNSLRNQTWLEWLQTFNYQWYWLTNLIHFITFFLAAACLLDYFNNSWDEIISNL